jgi:hypothetical protein
MVQQLAGIICLIFKADGPEAYLLVVSLMNVLFLLSDWLTKVKKIFLIKQTSTLVLRFG